MKIVAVTCCSVGIAHTYMAAGGIEKACKEKGYGCKVETQGSVGIEDKLSAKEIADADLVIRGYRDNRFRVGNLCSGLSRDGYKDNVSWGVGAGTNDRKR